jgi:hypothetical protein
MAAPTPSRQVLDELAANVRRAIQAAQAEWSNALGHMLDAGDALIEAQSHVSGGWKRWLRNNCFLGVSTAQLYMQLARHRQKIEAEIQRVGDLSLRAARRLISEPTEKMPKPEKLVPKLLIAWNQASDTEKTEALVKIKLVDFLRVMPDAWRTELKTRGINLDNNKIGHPDSRISKILRTALSHIAIADRPETGKPAAQGQEHAALAALRAANVALHAIGRDLHDLEVTLIVRPERSSKRRRAA